MNNPEHEEVNMDFDIEQYVEIQHGSYRNNDITGTFPLIAGLKNGAKGWYVTVDARGKLGADHGKIRVRIPNGPDSIRIIDADGELIGNHDDHSVPNSKKTDAERMSEIAERFEILEEMTHAAKSGDVRALVVSGPPGLGKSFGVEKAIEEDSIMDQIGNKKTTEVVKGTISPVHLYCKLWEFSKEGMTLVFDDCDSALLDDVSLNLFKAALDTGKKRIISWHSDSHVLREKGIENSFEFKGSVIFITNLKFDKCRGRIAEHLEALMSRSHYLDLTLDTVRDRMLRIWQVHRDADLFGDFTNLTVDDGTDIIHFLEENKDRMQEISLRMVIKLAGLCASHKRLGGDWKRIARVTCMK